MIAPLLFEIDMRRILVSVLAVAVLFALPVCGVRREQRETAAKNDRGEAPELDGDNIDADALRLATDRMTASILAATNGERASRGLAPLRLDPRLTRAAEDRIRDMYSSHYFDHVAPDGTVPFVWFEREHYRFRDAGENLATGYNSGRSVVADWMNSPLHRSNVLGARYVDLGIAIAPGNPTGDDRGATVVALYGREMPAASGH